MLWQLGILALEERDYESAHQVLLASYDRAQRVSGFEATELLSLLCDAGQVTTLAFPHSKAIGDSKVRKILEERVAQVTTSRHLPVSSALLSKIVISTGEVGSTQLILDSVDEYCNGTCAQHLNSAATEGLLELLLGHEYVRLRGEQGTSFLQDAQEAYLNAYRKLRGFSEYAELRPYALLCAARVAGTMQDRAGEELFLRESANDFIALPSSSSSLATSLLLLDAIASHAALSPHFRYLFEQVFERTELPLHHLVAGLSLWSRPYCITARLKSVESLEQQNDVIEDARKMIDRAETLARDVTGISNSDRVLLSVSRVHMALRDGEEDKALAPLHEGLRLAAEDPRCVDLIFPCLVEVVWDWDHAEYADQLCSMFEELIQLTPPSERYNDEVADFKSQLVVGLANCLPYIRKEDKHKAEVLTTALENLLDSLKRRHAWSVEEIKVFSSILEQGVNLVAHPASCEESKRLYLALRELHAESMWRHDCVETADIDWLREALKVEENALVIFQALGEPHRCDATSERANKIRREIEERIRAGESLQDFDQDDFPDEMPSF
jgi:hypothetical protein